MPRLCTVCASPARTQIDGALLAHQAAYRAIARQFGVGHDALMRHERTHLGSSFRLNQEAQAMMNTDRLIARMEELDSVVDRVLARAEKNQDDRLLLVAAREGRLNVDSLMRIGVMSDLEARVAALEGQPKDEDSDEDSAGD